MKKIVFLILASTSIFASESRQVTASVGSPVPSAYSTSDSQSLVLSEMKSSFKNLLLVTTMSDIACSLHGPSPVVAPGTDKEVFLLASEPLLVKDVGMIPNIYCRSTSGSKTSGWLSVTVY